MKTITIEHDTERNFTLILLMGHVLEEISLTIAAIKDVNEDRKKNEDDEVDYLGVACPTMYFLKRSREHLEGLLIKLEEYARNELGSSQIELNEEENKTLCAPELLNLLEDGDGKEFVQMAKQLTASRRSIMATEAPGE